MKSFKIQLLLLVSLMFLSAPVFSFDTMSLIRHPEIADKNSIFADVAIAPLSISDIINFNFNILPVQLRVDYLPPLPLPISIGFFIAAPHPNLKHFGIRAAYHFDLFDSSTDFYVAYSFDFGYIRNDILLEYNDTPVLKQFFDFRVGIKKFFKSRIGIGIETGYMFDSISISASIKIN